MRKHICIIILARLILLIEQLIISCQSLGLIVLGLLLYGLSMPPIPPLAQPLPLNPLQNPLQNLHQPVRASRLRLLCRRQNHPANLHQFPLQKVLLKVLLLAPPKARQSPLQPVPRLLPVKAPRLRYRPVNLLRSVPQLVRQKAPQSRPVNRHQLVPQKVLVLHLQFLLANRPRPV